MFLFYNSIIILVSFLLQSTLVKYLSIWDVKPDIILILVVYCGLFGAKSRGIYVGFFAGFIQDCLSYGLLGINTLTKGLIGFFLGKIKVTVLSDNSITNSLFIILCSLINDAFILIFLNVNYLETEISYMPLILTTIYQALYNAFLGSFIFSFLISIEKKFFN